MSIEAAMRGVLVAATGVANIVATNSTSNDKAIRPERLAQTDSYPAIEIQITSETHQEDLGGWDGTSDVEVTLFCVAETAQQAAALVKAVRQTLTSISNVSSVHGRIESVVLTDTEGSYEPEADGSDEGVYVKALSCSVWFVE
ncbi:hypothetical protein Plim_4258 (plasmid) [Planctopirus limnophila DSM 3776]|uniref:Uncharacterized protein n=1 Tax=Planctopirus limnophila (strain ATCC 43296 / DSM 3776 / IFAM 1008 / Mu 290) TaxID=521674 RepID=D5SZE5_PLAL2|nr:DUF3168 domain-containing protein [Planctopirus limnophila]ADG70065.1 hypothetical protein Plim_4258 [Planctopirus limnophila DSM 3776]